MNRRELAKWMKDTAANETVTELNTAKAFHRVAVAERNAERNSVDTLRAENARLRAALKAEEDAHEVTHAHLVSLRKEYDRSGELLAQAEADRDRLRAALKPVLDYKYPQKGVFSVECEYAETILEMMTVVREAQRIYNESEAT